MAKIIEEIVVIKFSKIIKDDAEESAGFLGSTVSDLENLVQELVGNSVVVEVERA